ncbi:MAG: hypothetical protein RBR86_05070 [Pseudobdellovibrionaceae bacterium]|jgi:hypothetical protein|nr:hypothetical protein [Pseudobdellovibrionaceae bacterium]
MGKGIIGAVKEVFEKAGRYFLNTSLANIEKSLRNWEENRSPKNWDRLASKCKSAVAAHGYKDDMVDKIEQVVLRISENPEYIESSLDLIKSLDLVACHCRHPQESGYDDKLDADEEDDTIYREDSDPPHQWERAQDVGYRKLISRLAELWRVIQSSGYYRDIRAEQMEEASIPMAYLKWEVVSMSVIFSHASCQLAQAASEVSDEIKRNHGLQRDIQESIQESGRSCNL